MCAFCCLLPDYGLPMFVSKDLKVDEYSAVLMMDLQTDFLDEHGRMSVDRKGAEAVIAVANAILSGKVLGDALLIAIVSQFSTGDRVGNFFRHNAAIAGSKGAKLDRRIALPESVTVFAKERSSAFTNPELGLVLRAKQITRLYVLGVFAEGCVRATVVDAVRLGYEVIAIENAIASSGEWRKRFGLWGMKHAGASIISLDAG